NLSSSPDLCFFFFHTSALTEIYTLSLHDALPISSVYIKDKARGIGAALMIWLFFTLIFDGLVLFLLFQLIDYPLENLIVVLSALDRKSTRLNSSHVKISYAVFCLKKKKKISQELF